VGNHGQKGFYIGDWQASPAQGLLTRGSESEHLEPKAMEVLVYLASRPGEVVTREELEREVWRGALVGYDAVTSTIIKLRKALQDNARQPNYIATIPKKGYQLIASITYPEDEGKIEANNPVSGNTSAELKQKPERQPKQMIIVVLIGIIFIGLVWLWQSIQPVSVTQPNSNADAERPSIAVLPFENMSDDLKQEYLADGITEDIITDLSRLSNLLVIASNTSIKYKGRQVTPKKVGEDLNVVFVLKGSIRQLGNAVRVNAQLINTTTGFITWAQRYDRNITEVFEVQDEVTASIVNALAIKINSQEKNRLAKRATDSLKAYDFFQEGQKLFQVRTKEALKQAREAYQRAIELDPAYGRAYGAIAVSLATDFLERWTNTPVETLDRAMVLAEKAVELDDSTPQTHWALGFVSLMRKEYNKAEKAVTQAITIAPNYADGYGLLALIKNHLGQPERAIELNIKGMRLNPYYTWQYLYTSGMAYYFLEDYDAAVIILEKAQERNDNVIPVKLFLAASYVKTGRQNDAEWIVIKLQSLSPTVTITDIEKTIPIDKSEFKYDLLEDLRKAGIPEE
jgi:TolB-like protein/DNA-binding winged helix-turn-helix (wHTH) protein/Flp pilus assembly protein TadD